MSFLTRLFGPRSGGHPDRAVEQAVPPTSTQQISHAAQPASNAVNGVGRPSDTVAANGVERPSDTVAANGVERPSDTVAPAAASGPPVYHHGTCTVNHRSAAAAAKCRRTT